MHALLSGKQLARRRREALALGQLGLSNKSQEGEARSYEHNTAHPRTPPMQLLIALLASF
eukprot:COSAG01_NODE_60289_length_295_cov_1.484694_1_plen_59_part_10